MTHRTRRRIAVVALAPVAALVTWAGIRLAGVDLEAHGSAVGAPDVVAAALAGGLGAWYVVRLLERTTGRPGRWWPLVGSTALGVSLIGPSYLADGYDAAGLGALHIVTALVLIWGLETTLPGACEDACGLPRAHSRA